MTVKLSNFVALDLGSSKIAGIVAYIDKKGETKILSQRLHYSEGFKSGFITDLKAAENSIVNAIYALEKECGKNIKQIAVSLSGTGTKSYYVSHKIKISNNQVITKQDVKKLIQKAIGNFRIKDQEIIHYFPVEFLVDGNNSTDNPVGMFSKELACQLHIIAANPGLLLNLANCFAKCQVEITNIILAIYASGLACLTKEEKNLGAIILDIGARTTSLAVFVYGKLVYSGYIQVGGWHITSDIAQVFSVTLSTAEKLKVLYGNAWPTVFDRDKPINIDELEPDNQYNTTLSITAAELTAVIHARVQEIMNMIKAEYDKAIADQLIARRLVITGGGSMLRGIKELASTIFQKQVRIARPTILPGFAEDHNPGIYSTVIGIVTNQALSQQQTAIETGYQKEGNNWYNKAFTWIKENI